MKEIIYQAGSHPVSSSKELPTLNLPPSAKAPLMSAFNVFNLVSLLSVCVYMRHAVLCYVISGFPNVPFHSLAENSMFLLFSVSGQIASVSCESPSRGDLRGEIFVV